MKGYPDRPQMFATRYIRWLINSGAVNEIGPDAFAVLVAVVSLEDELRYSRPPNFYNDQLKRSCGIVSVHALIRARQRAIDAGLLSYTPGKKRRPGVYFVCGFDAESAPKTQLPRTETETKPQPSTPIPIPIKESARPAITDVEEYAKTLDRSKYQNAPNCAEPFVDYYTANGWKVGRTAMKDWRAAFRNWVRRQSEFRPGQASSSDEPTLDYAAEAKRRRSEIEQKRKERVS